MSTTKQISKKPSPNSLNSAAKSKSLVKTAGIALATGALVGGTSAVVGAGLRARPSGAIALQQPQLEQKKITPGLALPKAGAVRGSPVKDDSAPGAGNITERQNQLSNLSQTKSSQLLIANPSHSSIPAVKSNNIFEAIGGLFAAIGKGIINTINSIGKGISGLWNSIFGGKEATLKPTGQTQSSSTLGAGPLVLPVLSEAEGSNAEGRTHPSAAVKAGVKAVVENTVIKPTIEISKKIAAELLYAVDRLQQEAELLLSDLSEKKLDRIVEIIKFDVRLLETTNPLLGALVKGVSWAAHKLKEMISKKEKITMADLKAAAKELMGELKSIVRWLGGIRGQIQKSKISEGLVKTLQVIEERIHKLRPSVDHNLMQRVQKKLGLTGKLAIKIIMGTDALEKIASEKDSSIITKLAASLNPGAILSKTLESLRETKTISGADLVKSQAVLFIKLGSETLKLCYPILYGVQAVSVVVGEGTEKVMLARGAEAQKAEKWGDIAGEVVLFAGLGTLGNAGMKLIEKAVMTGGKGTFFFAINEVVAFGGGYLHNEWGVSASLTETLSEGVWIPLGIAGAKATKSVVAWSAKKLNLMSLSKQIESNVKSRKAEWKDETGKKGRAKEHAKLDQQINKYFSGKGKGFDQIQIKTSAKGMDQGAGGEVLLREISKAKSKLHGIKQRKRLFDETIADTGKNLADTGKNLADTGKNLADAKLRAGRFDAGIKGSRKQLRSLKPEGAIPYAESIIYEKAAEVIEHGAKPVVAGFEQMGKSNASYLKGVEIVKEKKHKISANFRTHDKILTNGFSGLQTILRQSKRAVAYGPIGGIVLMLSASISAAATTQQGEMQKPSHHNRLLGNGLNALRTIPLVSVWPTATKTMAPTVKKLGKTALELGGQGLRAAQEGGAKAKSATNQYISQTRNNAFNTAYKIHLTTKAAYQKTKAGLIEAGEWLNQSAVTSIKQTKTNTLDKAYQIDHAARAAYQKGKEIAGGTGVGR